MSIRESGSSGGSVTIDELIALNDEMAALVRAGVPLERGLIDAGRDLQGRLGGIVGDLGARLGQGERLPDAIAHSGRSMPEVYRAVVEAGLRSGRLSEALEGMARIARGYADARRAIGIALLYPLIVLLLAYGLALVFILQIAPRFLGAFDTLGLPPLKPLTFVAGLGESVAFWGPIPPLLLLFLAFYFVWSGRSAGLDSGSLGPLVRRLPLIGSMMDYFRSANFSELLALLIEHHVPLDESVRLAGDATGGRSFRASTRAFAEAIRRGEGHEKVKSSDLSAFPPMLGWILSAGRVRGDLASSLRHLAGSYRRKAEIRANFLRTALPTVLMVSIGGGAVILYTLLLFVPLTTLWNELSLPVNQ